MTAAAEGVFAIQQLSRVVTELSPQALAAVEGGKHVLAYLNPAFARLVGKEWADLIGRPFVEAVPEGHANGCGDLLDRVFRSGVSEHLADQEHQVGSLNPAYWSYAAWAVLGAGGRPAGVMIQVTDATPAAVVRQQSVAMNEALVLSAVRQHELAEEADALNVRLRDAHDRLEARVTERTAALSEANALLRDEILSREAVEAGRREVLGRLETAQEDERRHIARDLHDQLGQLLAGLSMGLKSLEETTPATSPARPHLTYLQVLTDRISREGHQLALDLRPTVLDDLGLPAAVASYAASWSRRSGVPVDVEVVGLEGSRLPAAVETVLYRVVQEALTNVYRHAAARRVGVVLQRFRDHTAAWIEDDGVGFDPPPNGLGQAGGRLGLLGMRERMMLVGGTLTIESVPGSGTTIIARVTTPVADQS